VHGHSTDPQDSDQLVDGNGTFAVDPITDQRLPIVCRSREPDSMPHWIDDHISTPMAKYPGYEDSRRSFGINVLGSVGMRGGSVDAPPILLSRKRTGSRSSGLRTTPASGVLADGPLYDGLCRTAGSLLLPGLRAFHQAASSLRTGDQSALRSVL
jgi:hypothetical protein